MLRNLGDYLINRGHNVTQVKLEPAAYKLEPAAYTVTGLILKSRQLIEESFHFWMFRPLLAPFDGDFGMFLEGEFLINPSLVARFLIKHFYDTTSIIVLVMYVR